MATSVISSCESCFCMASCIIASCFHPFAFAAGCQGTHHKPDGMDCMHIALRLDVSSLCRLAVFLAVWLMKAW